MKILANALTFVLPSSTVSAMRKKYHFLLSLRDPDQRYSLLSKINPKIHQTTAFTLPNRYPGTFTAAFDIVGDRNDLKILSFGCSTGDEIISLLDVFPTSEIIGAEINRHRLKTCAERIDSARVKLIHSNDKNIGAHGPYDVIFAMAVLQRTPHQVDSNNVTDLSSIYKFSKFDEQLRKFDSYLNPGGLIVIQNTQYRFCDSSIAPRYAVQPCPPENARLKSFDKNGIRVEDGYYDEFIFQKST